MSEPAPFTVPSEQAPLDTIKSIRAHGWAGLVASAVCAAFALRVFFIMYAPTRSFAAAFGLWRQDKGVVTAASAFLFLTLGSILTFNRLRRAASWAQLGRTDRSLSILGIIPAAVLYYPVVTAATIVGWGLFFLIMTYTTLVRRVENHIRWKSRGNAP